MAELSEKVQAYRARSAAEFGIEEFTCDTCPLAASCNCAFDPYNTDGDCLAEK